MLTVLSVMVLAGLFGAVGPCRAQAIPDPGTVAYPIQDPVPAPVSAPQPAPVQQSTPDADVPFPGPPPQAASDEGPPSKVHRFIADAKLYFTAPLRWTRTDWAWFAGAVAATAGSHGYDNQVRTHFVDSYAPGTTINPHDTEDLLPTAAILLGTMGWAAFTHDSDGELEAWSMQESVILSNATVYPLKYIIRRQGPSDTSNPNEWFKSGGSSFPSAHTAMAFAVGTVLAESGNDDYRWVRRVLGYGAGIGTGFLRLKHNAHWLSDTVAGAAIGTASAHFSMNRNYHDGESSSLMIVPIDRGVMLTYRMTLN